jgi:hypothetical protein
MASGAGKTASIATKATLSVNVPENICRKLSNRKRSKRLLDKRTRLVGGQDVVPRKHPSGCHERGERGNLALFRGFRESNARFSAAT